MSVDSSFLSFSANQIWSRRNILLLRRFVSCVAKISCALFGLVSGELNVSMIFLVSNGCNFASSSSITRVWPFVKSSGKSGGRVSSKFISVFFKLENPKSMLSKKLFALIASGESFVM